MFASIVNLTYMKVLPQSHSLVHAHKHWIYCRSLWALTELFYTHTHTPGWIYQHSLFSSPPSLCFLVPVTAVSGDVKAEAMANLKKLVRNRRNVPVLALPQLKRVPDFWGWYKHFMDTNNQEGVSGICFILIIQILPVRIMKQFLLIKVRQPFASLVWRRIDSNCFLREL